MALSDAEFLLENTRALPHRLRRTALRRPEAVCAAVVAAVAVVLALGSHAYHLSALADLLHGGAVSLVLFAVCGDALAVAFVPRAWGPLRPLIALGLGAASSALVLTALGIAHVPLSVSVWLVLAAGVVAAVLVRRRERSRAQAGEASEEAEAAAARVARRWAMGSWIALAAVLLCVALIPAWRTGLDSIYGVNPDAHQVAGIAVLFQHVPPTATDNALPIDTVPPSWRFRYPIFYGLAAASTLAHQDPILVFPAMAALLALIAAVGFGALAVVCLRLSAAAGMVVAAAVGMWTIALHLAWHPYWNQLWGFAMLPYAVLFGWWALMARDRRAVVPLVLVLVTLGIGYPLALPYPLVLLLALLLAHGRRPRLAALRRSVRSRRAMIGTVAAAIILLPALAGAAVKLEQGISQIVTPNGALWGGDITRPLPFGDFAGTGGGLLPALAGIALAVVGLSRLPRRVRWSLGIVLGALCLLDLRFRLVSTGAYMDFKHLSYVSVFVLVLAVAGIDRLVRSRRRGLVAAGAVLALVWTGAALLRDHTEAIDTGAQVTREMFAIRHWAAELPPGASVRVDIPPSGLQLWAVYMLGDHPVDSPTPVLYTTYAHAPYGLRADYSLSLLRYPSVTPGTWRPYPTPPYATNPPVASNDAFVLRRIAWPARLRGVPQTASTALVEP